MAKKLKLIAEAHTPGPFLRSEDVCHNGGTSTCDVVLASRLFNALKDMKRPRAGSSNLLIVNKPGSPEAIQSISRKDLDSAIHLLEAVALVPETRCPVEDQLYERTVG